MSDAKAAEIEVEVVPDASSTKSPSVSLRTLFRYSDTKDCVLLAIGTLTVIISGANQPLQLVVFGQLMNSFNLTTKEEVKEYRDQLVQQVP